MIELRGLVAAPGLSALNATVRVGEVVRLDGAPAAARAVLEVIAGRRAAIAGDVVWRDPRGRGVLVRAGDALPPGIDAPGALALWRALAGGGDGEGDPRGAQGTRARRRGDDVGGGAATDAARRGFGVAPVVWLVEGAAVGAAKVAVDDAEELVRGGSGALLWTGGAGRDRADRAILVEEEAAAGEAAQGERAAKRGQAAKATTAATARGGEVRRIDRARAASALVRFAAAAAASRAAIACAVVSALWLAVVAAALATHEGFWYVEGSRHGLGLVAWIGALGAATAAAVAAATRAAVGRAWPAMLRETRAQPAIRALALTAGDAAGAAPAAVVAAWPSTWMSVATTGAGPGRALLAALAVVIAAVVAGAVTRGARSMAALGALVGVGVGAWLMW